MDLSSFFIVSAGITIFSFSASISGCLALLNKRSLISDAISHGVLPGICLAFLFLHEKNYLVILLGAFGSGWLCSYLTDMTTHKTKIKPDTSIAIFLSFFFAVGLMLMSEIRKIETFSKSGLNHFLIGNASSILPSDIPVFLGTSLVVLAIILIFFRGFQTLIFDKGYASSIGFPVRLLQVLLTSTIIFSVIIGIQSVGVVLVAALLITPASAAYYWSQSLKSMMFISAIFSVFGSFGGILISHSFNHIPTGPIIVLILTLMAVVSLFFSRKKGVIFKLIQSRKNNRKIQRENLLKQLFKKGLEFEKRIWKESEILKISGMEKRFTLRSLRSLNHKYFVNKIKDQWQLTQKGEKESKRIIKNHRLWELYLSKRLSLPADHLHEDAETIEHIITPELQELLEKQLEYPKHDPHKSLINL